MIRSSGVWAVGGVLVLLLLSSAVAVHGEQAGRPEQTQEQSAAGVSVKVSLQGEGGAITVTVALNTHSVNLDGYQFDKIVVLRTGGKDYPAKLLSQEGSGHHRSATVEFTDPGTKNVEIVVKDVAGVKERPFPF